jgi:3-deoxy-manno-octulosonate cytidylyltransferase (CMP-KDO synthetase)
MTSDAHATGLDRIAEVAADLACEIIVNVQGDEPLIEPRAIAEVIAPFDRDPSLDMTTLRRRITDPDDIDNPHVVKVVVDRRDRALYFSRSAVPFVHDPRQPIFKHIGLYAYRRAFVRELAALPRTPLELAESLEQLRALEHGFHICAVETHYDSIGVDTPEDLERVRRHMTVGTRA